MFEMPFEVEDELAQLRQQLAQREADLTDRLRPALDRAQQRLAYLEVDYNELRDAWLACTAAVMNVGTDVMTIGAEEWQLATGASQAHDRRMAEYTDAKVAYEHFEREVYSPALVSRNEAAGAVSGAIDEVRGLRGRLAQTEPRLERVRAAHAAHQDPKSKLRVIRDLLMGAAS